MRPSRAAHHCRRCRLKLGQPTENPRSAFCCRGCHRQFYETRCLACERGMPRKTGNRLLCGRRPCSTKFRELKRHIQLGRYHPAGRAVSASETPIKIGVEGGGLGRRTPRVVAGSLTPEQLLLATVGGRFGSCPFDADRRTNHRQRIDADRREIEAAGCFGEPDWREVISSGGTRCLVAASVDQ